MMKRKSRAITETRGLPLESDHLPNRVPLPVWMGALGKWWVANEIVDFAGRFEGRGAVRVLDLGAGRGEGWTSVLETCQDIELFMWDPGRKSVEPWTTNRGIYVESLNSVLPSSFDFVTSMSVVEHVNNLNEHLELFQRFMCEEGTGILLWDDGHFRPVIDPDNLKDSISLAVKEIGKWWLSLALRQFMSPRYFQRRRELTEVVAVAEQVGLQVVGATYIGLRGIKSVVAPTLADRKLKFLKEWFQFEQHLISISDSGPVSRRHMRRLFGSRMVIVRK